MIKLIKIINIITILMFFSLSAKSEENKNVFDEQEWNSMVSSLKTLLSDDKNIEVWSFMAPTFPQDFVDFVNEKIEEGKVYSGKGNN